MTKQHDFKKIIADIENERIKSERLVVFFGIEDFLSDWSTDLLVESFINPASKEMDYLKSQGTKDTITLDYIYNFLHTMPMLSQKRLLVLESADLFEGMDDLNGFINDIPDTALLVFKNIKLDKRKTFYKRLNKNASIYEFDKLNPADLNKFVRKRFKQAEVDISPDILNNMIGYSGYFDKDSSYTLRDFEGDVSKVIAHSQGGLVTESDIVATMESSLDTNVFAMLDAICMGDKKNAFEILSNILTGGESVLRLLALIIGQVEIMLAFKELSNTGSNVNEIEKILKVNSYRLQKAGGFANRLQEDRIEKALINAYDVEKNIKTGIFPDKLALEMFVAKF